MPPTLSTSCPLYAGIHDLLTDALIALATTAFEQAAQEAVAENDRLGITTHGSVNGEIVERHFGRRETK